MYVEGIVSPAALQKYGKDYFMHPTGTGPYKFERWVKGGEFVTKVNESYWGGRSWMNQAIWRTTTDDTVRLQQLLNGEIDATLGLDAKDIGRVRADKRFQVITGTLLNTMNSLMNTKRPPFDKLEARQAVQFAINKENIKKAVFFDNFTVGAGPISPGLLGYDKSLGGVYAHNPTRAKELVQRSGAGSVPITLIHINTAFWPQVAQLVLSDLQAAGFNVTLQSMDTAAFLAKINAGEHQISLGQWVYDTGDPDNIMFTTFSTPRADARLGHRNADVTKLNTDAQVERSPDKRRELYVKAQRLVLEDAAYVTIGYRGLAWGAKAGVKGLVIGPLGDAVIRGVTTG
jgi:peptide/nickel transport system substrate-binding protein